MEKLLKKFRNLNFALVIKVKVDELKFPIVLFIPLFIFEDLLNFIIMLGRLGYFLIPVKSKYFNLEQYLSKDDLFKILKISSEFIGELRKYGRFTLVEVKDEGVNVSIKIY